MEKLARHFGLAAAALLAVLWPAAAGAQSGFPGCRLEPMQDPPRQVLSCGGGLTVTTERGAAHRLTDRDGDGEPDVLGLRGGAAMVDRPAGGPRFEVVTPQAIAAVRGTRWAVDVAGGRTAVFAVTGSVEVRRAGGGAAVTLRAGEGVDVDGGGAALDVKRWGAARVSALLARLGG